MNRQATKMLLLTASAILLSGCKIIVNDAVYCNQSALYSNESNNRSCIQMDSNEISMISTAITRAKTYKRPEFVSYHDGYYLPGELKITTNSSRQLSCKVGVNKLLCETSRVIEIGENDENSYDKIFSLISFYSKLGAPSAPAISCRELILNRLQKHDSAMIMIAKDLEYYTAATCITAERNSIPPVNNGSDALLKGINYLRNPEQLCIPGTEPPSFDSLSSKLSQSIVEFVGRFREFRFDQSQIPVFCENSNLDSINNWAINEGDYHEKAWAGFIENANNLHSLNPNCDTVFRKSGIATEIMFANKFIKTQKQK